MKLVGLGAWALGLCVTSSALAQYGQQPQQQGQGMEAGGLAPPAGSTGSPDPYGASTPTEQELERAEREDAGRGLEFFWMNGEVGFEHLGLQTFKANDLVDAELVETTQTGPVFGGGLGVRLVFLTLGARFRLGSFAEWQLWTLNGELGIRIPLGAFEPYFTLGGGYASIGAFDTANVGTDLNKAGVDITGFDIRGGFGFDYYFSNAFSLGANLTGELLFLTRPGATASALQGTVYAADGSSIGSGVTLTAVIGLHF